MFSKPTSVIWPKNNSVDIYLDKSNSNIFSLDFNLWQACTPAQLQSLDLLLKQNSIDSCTILLPDDVVFTKSFIYDSVISTIDKAEVIGLAESFINFKIHPDNIDYQLIPSDGKTIILAHIYERNKISALETNLKALPHLKSYNFTPVSQSISNLITSNLGGSQEYFAIHPLNQNEYTLILSSGKTVYLTSNLKGDSLDIQKIINYSKLYFPGLVNKFYVPSDKNIELKSTTELDKTAYNQAEIAQSLKKPTNLPLPVLGVIINPSMENKKNLLPFIAVFVTTAAIASIIIWFVLSKNPSTDIENPSIDIDAIPTSVVQAPTEAPTPTPVEISKTLKLQVLNATDINGQAAILKEKLTALGFTSVAVGNSPEKFTENKIKTKAASSTASAYFDQELGDFFTATSTSDLSASSTYDVVFYIGKDLSGKAAATSTATATPTKKVTATPTVSE
jgi:hypothetical protein